GRLSTHPEPVPRSLGVHLDQRGLLGGVVLADLLDRPAVPLGAGVGDDDPVERCADLSHPLQTDLDGQRHSWFSWVAARAPGWGPGAWRAGRTWRGAVRGPQMPGTADHCARTPHRLRAPTSAEGYWVAAQHHEPGMRQHPDVEPGIGVVDDQVRTLPL